MRPAASIRRSVRRNDLVGRWGGEEYVGIYSIASPADLSIIGKTADGREIPVFIDGNFAL